MGGSAGDGKRSAPGDSLAIYPSKIKAIIYGLLMIVFILGGLWIVFDAQADWLHEFAGIAIVVIMGYALSFIIIRALFSSAPLLMIDRQGIWLFWRPAPTGLIKWSEIDMLQVGRKSRLSPCSLYIHLVDVQTVIARQSRVGHIVRRILGYNSNMRRTGSAVINDGLLSMSMPAVLAEIQVRFHHELAHNHVRVI